MGIAQSKIGVCACACVCVCVGGGGALIVIGSEKTTLMAQNVNMYILCRVNVTSVLSILFVSGAYTFRCVVMGANARRCSRTQNEIIASKRELPVKTLNICILT